jgi:hypothetical protein
MTVVPYSILHFVVDLAGVKAEKFIFASEVSEF